MNKKKTATRKKDAKPVKSAKTVQAVQEPLSAGRFKIHKIYSYISVLVIVFLAVLLAVKLGIKNDEATIKMFMAAALGVLAAIALYLKQKDRLTYENIVLLIIAAGIIMRVGYMLYTDIYTRTHDSGSLKLTSHGHLGYILNLANGIMPDTNTSMFYHPPFFHMAAALFVNIGRLFCSDDTTAFAFAQIVNCTMSCWMLLALKNFADEIKLGGKYKLYLLAIISFLPNFYLMGGRLNNDMICTFCMLLCVINTYRWYKRRDMKTIIFLALSFGIGMMAKISCGVLAIITGAVMIYCLVCDFKAKKYKGIVSQLAVFAVICLPLALWYPIRNLILFDQPLGYVLNLGTVSELYVGDVPLYKRLFEVSLPTLMRQPFADPYNDYSLPMALIRTSVAGEWTYEGMEIGYRILIISSMLTGLFMTAATIHTLIKRKDLEKPLRFGLFAVGALLMASYVQFNIAYPHGCTADFRYIALVPVIGACYAAYAMQSLDKSDSKYAKYLRTASNLVVVLWCVFSVAVYI